MIENFDPIPLIRDFPSSLHSLVKEVWGWHTPVVCAGGFARYLCSPRKEPSPAKDIDLYFLGEDLEEAFESFSKLKEHMISRGFQVKRESPNAVDLRYPKEDNFSGNEWDWDPSLYVLGSAQLIIPAKKGAVVTSAPTMCELLESFDYTVSRIGILLEGIIPFSMADINFKKDEKQRQLVIKNIHCPVSSLLRSMKYSRKGYYLSPLETVKILRDWEDRPDDYRNRLQELLESEELTEEEVEEMYRLLRID